MDIRRIREDIYAVTCNRDGQILRYEFTRRPPVRPGLPESLDYDDQVVSDLIDYEAKPPPGRPHGAIVIPSLDKACQIVYRVADGHSIDFPIVLDER